MPETALITGANGFVGSHLTDVLLEAGWTVRCLVRKTSRLHWIPRDRVSLVFGDVATGEGLSQAVADVDVVIHNAGITTAQDEKRYVEVNAEGAGAVAAAAANSAKPPRRLVLVSSLAAGGPSNGEHPRRETDADTPDGPYGRSKLLGEKLFAERAGAIPWTTVRPPAVYGPRDDGFLKLARMVKRGLSVRVAGSQQPVSLIHVRDLADGLLRAAVHSAAERRVYYLANAEPITLPALNAAMGSALGNRPRDLSIPRLLVPWVGRLSGLVASLGGRPNPFPVDRLLDLLTPGWACDSARIAEEIGFTPRIPLEEGMIETIRWYQREGWL